MRLTSRIVLQCALIVLLAAPSFGQKRISSSDARKHIGEIATVCGEVVSTHYARSTKGQPTFLNLDKPYPNHEFTILIWGENRSEFGTPEIDYKEKHVCVTGKITEYRGAPEIVASKQSQIRIE